MIKIKSMKRVLAAVAGAATLAACTAASLNIADYSTVSAADGENYAEALAMSLYFFDANECGTEVDDNPVTWRGNCHTYDAEASLDNAQWLGSAEKEAVRAANGGSNTVDVSGGYHDAGDHVKFNLTMGFAASSLSMSYYLNPGAYEKAGCEAHMKEVLKNTCDYLMKTTYLNDSGEVYAVCATVSNQTDHNVTWEPPENQTYDRPTYWLTASRNNAVITATMSSALAGTAYVLKDSDPAYSAECLKYSKALYDFSTKYTSMEDVNDGMYTTTDTYVDDLALAQTWLYLNGEASLPTYKPTANGCYNNQYYDYHLYCWDKVWSGYATMMYHITGDQAFASEMQFELSNKGGVPTNSYNAAGWGASRYNCALQMVALELAGDDANSTYALGAKYQTDYLLGNNQKSTSFLIGYGDTWPQQIHHRAANPNKTGATHVLYGSLVGGPTDSNCTYTDYWEQYESTEPALDYNACFALACAGLVNLYGGDASALDAVIAAAPEIDETYVFGGGSVNPPVTEPTTEPTTEPATGTDPGSQYDVNSDGNVNISDLIVLQRYLLKDYELGNVWTTDGLDLEAIFFGSEQLILDNFKPDVNLDNKINAIDCAAEKRFLIYADFA
ncbi:MAG: glycoside hydrolase family 9 protein [Porcipelethomonas sp.]